MDIQTAKFRAEAFRKIRAYFDKEGVLEVETPILSSACSIDQHIDYFHTELFSKGDLSNRLYLQTSPELFMKNLLCQGFPSIYQFCKVFRNSERGGRHNPEFTLLEWYRRGYSYRKLILEVFKICELLLGTKKCEVLSYGEAFEIFAGVNIFTLSYRELLKKAEEGEDGPLPFTQKTDLLNYMLTKYIEPNIPADTLFAIYNYPVEQAVLAKKDSQNAALANRFEVYYNRLELCNGFEELQDPLEYQRRFEEENRFRRLAGKQALPIDHKFLEAMKKGLPPCAGVALGIDRLIMAALGKNRIQDVISFPIDKV